MSYPRPVRGRPEDVLQFIHDAEMSHNKVHDAIDSHPFLDEFFRRRALRLRWSAIVGAGRCANDGAHEQTAAEFGWNNEAGLRRITRWLASPSGLVDRAAVEDALMYAGIPFGTLYPEWEVEVELEPDVWCTRCYETVTPIHGECPWCVPDRQHAHAA